MWTLNTKKRTNTIDIVIFHNKRVVGHVPNNFSKLFYHFLLLPGCSIGVEVTGKRVNRGSGYGLEIPVCYRITGPEKAKSWIKNNITKASEYYYRILF